MTESQRKAIYAAAAAILTALGAYGVVDAAMTDKILGIVSGALTLAMAVVPVIAHRKVGASGVDSSGVLLASDEGMNPPAAVVDESDPGMTPPEDDSDDSDAAYEPEHAAQE